MHYYWGLGSVAAVIFIFCILAYVLMKQKKWFLVWLKGTLGVSFLLISIALGLTLYPMMDFKTLNGEVTLAEIKVDKIAEQNFNLKIEVPLERSQTFNFNGDQWVMNVMSVDWMKPLQVMGIQQGYLISDLESSYFSAVQAKKLKSSKHAHNEKLLAYRVWKYLEKYRRVLPILNPQIKRTQPTKFIDGAHYKITYTTLGAKIRPLNEIAKSGLSGEEEGESSEPNMIDVMPG